MTVMIERDEAAGATANRYHYTRTVEIAGRTVQARVERDFYINQSLAVAEVLNDQMTWTKLAAEAPGNWWHDTPTPRHDVHAVTVLGPLTEQLLRRAAEILAAPPTTVTVSPHVHGAISALLATSYGFDAEHRIDPDEIAWAYSHGGALHIIEHPDGSVTFTKAHRDDCPFITSAGTQDCDEDCYFEHPADAKLQLGE
ncbi:hypothetical protein [Saccharothrix deserti]|uniref:hypothetical protein n=1 Tax=Saccharothrix deserti TaxID=2593674 RepID=UPI00131B4359|nr:hypothetical protein [Saccharothrix deserti]